MMSRPHARRTRAHQDREFAPLRGERVTLFCLNYIYAGLLTEITAECVCLTEAAIIYETGDLLTKTWRDAQPLPHEWYVSRAAIESFGILK